MAIKRIFSSPAFLLFVTVFLAYSYFATAKDGDPNVNSRIGLVKAIVEEHRLEIDTFQARDFRTIDLAKINGHYYSDKAIGTSVLGIAFYFPMYLLFSKFFNGMGPVAFTHLLTIFVIGFPCALLAPLIYKIIFQMTDKPSYAALVSLLICLGTPLFKYSSAYYGHAIAGLFYLGAFYIWFQTRQQGKISLPKSFLSGLLIGYLILIEYPTLILALTLGIYILFTVAQFQANLVRKTLYLLVLGFVLPIMLLLFYNYTVFGNPLSVGYLHEMKTEFLQAHQTNLMGIGWPKLDVIVYTTFHPTMGIFWQSPITLLACWGWLKINRLPQYRLENLFALTTVFIYIIVFSGYYMWWGGVSFTPRHLIPILPLFCLPLALIPDLLPATLVSGILSVGQNLIATATLSGELLQIDNRIAVEGLKKYFGSTLYHVYFLEFFQGRLVPNLTSELTSIKSMWSILPLFLLELPLLNLIFRRSHD